MARKHAWLIAYDIAHPGRLRRVHKLISRHAQAVQYSVFAAIMTDTALHRLMTSLARLMDEQQDDIRAWRLTPETRVWLMGRDALSDGIWLAEPLLTRLLEAEEERRA